VLEDVLGNPERIAYLDVLREMGGAITVHARGERGGEPVVDIEVEASALHGTVIASREAIVDELPVLAVAGAFAEGPTEIVDAAELRVKESDRVATLAEELGKLGVGVEVRPDGLGIRGGAAGATAAVPFAGHGDHRIAMAAAVAAAAGTGDATVTGWDAVAISYPEFAAHLRALGGAVG
jgi:3-phosphoshikimate 1-carboxyvinyltransferase